VLAESSPASGDQPVKVLFVMGSGRSGTTILDNILGEVDGFFSAGELRYLWERGLLGQGQCGAGDPVAKCEVWSAVLRATGGEPSPRTSEAIVRWQNARLRSRNTPSLLFQAPGKVTDSLGRYVDLMRRVYRAIADVTGSRVVIDSSKRPSDAALLRLIPGIDAYLLHVVRDPRAVAFSWKRPKAWRKDGSSLMRIHGAAYSTSMWVGYNVGAEIVMRRMTPSRRLRIRYEDFVAAPREVVGRIVKWIGEPVERLPFIDSETATLTGNHSVSGNPSRFKIGAVPVRDDDSWRRRQEWRDRATVTALALPFLARYRYPVRAPL
jgi:hypothetical protein